MSYAPDSLRELQTAMRGWTGLSPISLGIVGDTRHTRGYHLGKDRIYDGSGPGIGAMDYSVKTSRDIAGLTNAASAMDIGNFAKLRAMSKWLVLQCQQNAPGTRDIREIIYTPDGSTVLRYDRQRGYNSTPRPGEADNSHLTHTHISWYRDSEERDKVALFARYFGSAAGDEIVKTFNVPEFPGRNATPKEDAARPGNSVWLYSNSELKPDGTEISLKPIRALQVVAMEIVPGVTALAYEPAAGDDGTLSKVVFVARTNIARSAVNVIPDAAACQTALAAAQASVATLGSRIAAIKNKVKDNAAEIAQM